MNCILEIIFVFKAHINTIADFVFIDMYDHAISKSYWCNIYVDTYL